MPRTIVFELNEVPPRVLRKYAQLRPKSCISTLLNEALVLTSKVNDVDKGDLYPSQTWASFNTGATYDAHKIHWYNDPKPDEFPLYWRVIADHNNSVGLVNTLHSSPALADYSRPNYAFVIPDCFASDTFATPAKYQPFQALNLAATKKSGRVASTSLPLGTFGKLLPTLPRLGIRPKTYAHCAHVAVQIARKKVNKERLRTLQFPLIADIFFNALKHKRPDLAVLFTNHVAANMHRYWYALFPEDYEVEVYGPEWVQKYREEILYSMDILDRYLQRLMRYCRESATTLLITSSMGQEANDKLPERIDKKISRGFRLDHIDRLMAKLVDSAPSYKVEQAMIPQYSLRFDNVEVAETVAQAIRAKIPKLENIYIEVDVNEAVVTLSSTLTADASFFGIDGTVYSPEVLGFTEFPIEDHHSGRHSPEGSVIVFNSPTAKADSEYIDYLEFTPALLTHYGIEPKPYMVSPTFKI